VPLFPGSEETGKFYKKYRTEFFQDGLRSMVTIVNDELLIVSLSGIFDTNAILALAHELNVIEAAGAYPKRLVFVEENLVVSIKSDDVMFFRSQRQELKTAVRSAFCAFNDFQYGFARMFQTLLESEKHTIKIFRDRESAAQWLDVDVELFRGQTARGC
jgi:hypothetical protein